MGKLTEVTLSQASNLLACWCSRELQALLGGFLPLAPSLVGSEALLDVSALGGALPIGLPANITRFGSFW